MSQIMRAFCLLLSFALGFCQTSSTTSRSFLADTTTMPCPSGYSNGGDGSCYSALYQNSRNYAYYLCSLDGGYLYSISSASENNKTITRAGSLSTVWLGMTCTSNLTTSCAWDISPTRTLSTFDYSNFAAGQPNISQGPCVYMDVSTGLWLSADCSLFTSYYGCRWTSGVAAPFCSRSVYMGFYYDTYAFRNKCYWSITQTDYLAAKSACTGLCGTVASIHSFGENSFIQSLSNTFAYAYAYTGLTLNTTGKYGWDDGSAFNFNNFGYQNQELGNCVTMALRSDLAQAGQWINSDCGQRIPTVCEKNQINTCDTTPTRAPVFCPTPQFFSGNGIIYSPGYPYGMDSNSCEYLITVDQNRTAQIYFSSITLSYFGKLIFYSDINSRTPFQTLTDWYSPTTVISSTNVIRMFFNSSSNSDASAWVANYGAVSFTTTTMTTKPTITPSSQECRYATLYSNNGTISSPGYPQTCNTENYCAYKITEGSSYLALISFSDIYLPSSSKISFYSNDTASTPFKTLTSQYSKTAVVSPTNFIKMIYTTNYGDGSYWAANYTSAPNCNTSKSYSGTITSDGYPNYYSTPDYARNCTYKLNSQQSQTCIFFDSIDLRVGDYIRVYDGAVGGYQIVSFGSSSYRSSNPTCTTRSSEMNVVFQVQPNNGYVARGFSARFTGSVSSVNYYFYSGFVTSENYPGPYSYTTQNTAYVMDSNQAKTCLVFDTCSLHSRDYITLYDGNFVTNWSAAQITKISANDGVPNVTYCSNDNEEITLIFSTSQYGLGISEQGFKVRFAGSERELNSANSTLISFHFFVAFFTFVWSFLG